MIPRALLLFAISTCAFAAPGLRRRLDKTQRPGRSAHVLRRDVRREIHRKKRIADVARAVRV